MGTPLGLKYILNSYMDPLRYRAIQEMIENQVERKMANQMETTLWGVPANTWSKMHVWMGVMFRGYVSPLFHRYMALDDRDVVNHFQHFGKYRTQ